MAVDLLAAAIHEHEVDAPRRSSSARRVCIDGAVRARQSRRRPIFAASPNWFVPRPTRHRYRALQLPIDLPGARPIRILTLRPISNALSGKQVHVVLFDEAAETELAVGLGVDGTFTDRV